MIRKSNFINKSAISASRIDSYSECSAKYAYRYLFKLPDSGNDGSNRGSVSHDTFQTLSNKRHKYHVNSIVKERTVKTNPSVWRLVKRYAAKYKVNDPANLDLIDSFVVTGLSLDFFGPQKTKEILTETDFDFEVEEEGKNYRLKGFIDKIYLVEEQNAIVVHCKDYKSSKNKFDQKKIEFNHQAIIYQLAISKFLFPDYPLKSFDFIFLKFSDDPIQQTDLLTKSQLSGYERWLTQIQRRINNFSLADVASNYAANDFTLKRTRCGKEGFKKTGEKYFICQAQQPFRYFALLEKDGKVSGTSMKDDLQPKDGERVERRFYPGCSYFYDPDGNRIRT